MGFQNGSYAKIKEVETKERFTKAKIVISKKVQNSDKYVCDFAGWVTFLGKAHQCRPLVGQRIKLGSCSVSNGYLDRDGNQQFSKSPQFSVFDYELQDGGNGGYVAAPQPNWEELSTSDDLPF